MIENNKTKMIPNIEIDLKDMDPKIARLIKAYEEFKSALYAVEMTQYDFLRIIIKK